MTMEAETRQCGYQPRDTWGPNSWTRTQPPSPQPSLPRMTPHHACPHSIHAQRGIPARGTVALSAKPRGEVVLAWGCGGSRGWQLGLTVPVAWTYSGWLSGLGVPISGCDLPPHSRAARDRGPAAWPGAPGEPMAPRPRRPLLTWGAGTPAARGLQEAAPGTGWASKRTSASLLGRVAPHPGDSSAGPEATPWPALHLSGRGGSLEPFFQGDFYTERSPSDTVWTSVPNLLNPTLQTPSNLGLEVAVTALCFCACEGPLPGGRASEPRSALLQPA